MSMAKNRNRIRRSIKSTEVTCYAVRMDDITSNPELLTYNLPAWYKDDDRLMSVIRKKVINDGYYFVDIVGDTKRYYALYEMTMDEFLDHAHIIKEYDDRQETL